MSSKDDIVIRDSASKMMKHGRWRAWRNIPVGWLTQSVHSTDKTETWFRVILELIAVIAIFVILIGDSSLDSALIAQFVLAFVLLHTVFWFLFGNFWVYMLDSFDWVENGGIHKVIDYVTIVSRVYSFGDSSQAILIYGSMARSKFHDGSDLDLRVLRRVDSAKGLFALLLAALVKIYAFIIRMPVDFQVVDSLEFLGTQMRDDEHPIVVYKREGFSLANEGVDFVTVMQDPESVLRDTSSG